MRVDANKFTRELPGKLLDAPGKVVQGAVNTFMPDPEGPAPSLADPLDPAVSPAAAAPAAAAPAAPPPGTVDPTNPLTQSAGGSGSASMSASMSLPGAQVQLDKTDPKYMAKFEADVKARDQQIADLHSAVQDRQFSQDELMRQAGIKRVEAEKFMQDEAALAAELKLNAVNEARRYQTAKTSALEEASKAAQTPTDPNRYWNNKDAGQKAAAVIAGALFGFTGQGMQWLQRIDGLVNEDNRLQQADRASKVQGLEAKARGFGEAANFAMQAGASEAEAHVIARQMKLESLNSYLQRVRDQTQSLELKTKADEMLLGLSTLQINSDQQGVMLNQQATNQRNSEKLEQRKLDLQAAQIRATLGGGASSGLKPGEIAKLDEARQGYEAVTKLKELLGPESPMGKAIYDEVTAKAGQLSEAGRRKKSVEPFRRALIRLIDASAIQKADQEFWKDKISNVGLDNMSQSDLDGLQELFATQYNAVVSTHQSGLQPLVPPGKAQGVPSYATPRK
jgi:hypothetical protein